MMTSLCLLKLIRRLNGISKNVLPLYQQSVSLSTRKYVSLINTQSQKQCSQDVDFQKKMDILNFQIGRYGRISKFNIEDILRDIEKSRVLTSLQGLFLLRCMELVSNKSLRSKQILADDIWRVMTKLEVEMDVSHYNALLAVYLETDYDFSPPKFLKKMIDIDVKPNRVTFQRLILQSCKLGNLEEAHEIVEYMKNEGISLNEEILSSFITAHFMNNDMNAVFAILNGMESMNISPTILMYSALMYGFAEKGDLESIHRILEECKQKEIWVSDKVLLNIIYKLSINNFIDHIDEILSLTSRGGAYVKEANKIIYKLVEKGLDKIASKIFQTIPIKVKDYETKSGQFFIQTLIDSNVSIEKSAKYCKIMEEEGRTQKAFSSAIHISISNDSYDTGICLMKAWKELGGHIRENYFYPILKTYGEAKQEEELINTLKEMVQTFELNPSIYTLKNYVLPFLKNNEEEILTKLLNCKVDIENASHALILHLLSENKIREVIKLISTNFLSYRINMVKYSLLQAFKNTEDAPSFVWILHYLYQASLDEKLNVGTSMNIDQKYLSQQFIDSSILEASDFLLSSTSSKYLNVVLFRNLVDKGLSISPDVIEIVKSKLGTNIMPEVAESLSALGSGTLVPKPIQREFHTTVMRRLNEIEKLESTAKLLSVTNFKAAEHIKKKLLSHYCFSLNEKKVTEILKEFEVNDTSITTPMYALIIEMYGILLKVDQVEIWITKVKEKFADFKPNKCIILRLANMLVRNNEFEKAIWYLTESTHSKSHTSTSLTIKLLLSVAKYNNEELLQQFYDILKANGYIKELTQSLFTPLIHIHILRGDTHKALEKFQWVYKNFNFIPNALYVMKMFINYNDEIKLKKILSIVIERVGKTKGYLDLAIAYLECNQLDKTKQILEEHCPRLYEDNIIFYAGRYYTHEQVHYLERLFEVLNSLNYDVEKLCVLLLKSYSVQNEWSKGYSLWLRMQKENIKPSNNFISVIYDAFKENAIDKNEVLWKFKDALQNFQIVKATKLLNSIPTLHRSDCYATICKIYSSRGQFSEVIDLWKDLRSYGTDLDSVSAEFILTKMLKQKQVESIERIGQLISKELKNQIKYSYYLTTVYLQSGSLNLYLKSLEKKLENEQFIMIDIHLKGTISGLNKHPELCEQFESLAYKYLEKNVTELLQVLWVTYFIQDNPKYDKIWTRYLKNSRERSWLVAIDFIGDKPHMLLKFATLLQESLLDQKVKLWYYTKLIKYCMELKHSKKYQFALECLQRALTELSMQQFHVEVLVDLQMGLEHSGVSWPWSSEIEEKNVKLSKTLIKELGN